MVYPKIVAFCHICYKEILTHESYSVKKKKYYHMGCMP
jgi:hypothetical protein